jgi:hypothetical protein
MSRRRLGRRPLCGALKRPLPPPPPYPTPPRLKFREHVRVYLCVCVCPPLHPRTVDVDSP